MQTAGVAFARHRSVFSLWFLLCYRCWWQLCNAFNCRILYGRYAANIYTLLVYHHTNTFITGLKPSFSANPFHRSLLFLLQDWLHGFSRQFTDTSEHIRFLLFSFSVFTFSCWLRAVDYADSYQLLTRHGQITHLNVISLQITLLWE